MTPTTLSAHASMTDHSFPSWLRWCSTTTFVASVGFLLLSLVVYGRHAEPIEGWVPALLVVLSFAIFLNFHSLWHLRRQHRETDWAFRNTDSEFSSIFQSALDGILIVDNEGDCLDANPAAGAILRISADKLIGRNLGRFLSDQGEFTQRWSSFLRNANRRGRVELIACDGSSLFVDFAATANYLPGRHVLILCDVTERTRTELSLKKIEERFRYMADNSQEVFWMLDAESQDVIFVNKACATLTGHTLESLHSNPSAYRELIHTEDRVRVLSKLQEASISGQFDEEFRLTRADGVVRWVWAKGFSPPPNGEPRCLVGMAQDITARKQAEKKISEHLGAAEAARAEAEALRKATLALSKNLAMDSVLDTLLHCISELVPFDKATVLFVEDGANLMIAREVPRAASLRIGLTFSPIGNIFLQRILFEKKAILIPNVNGESNWTETPLKGDVQSWMGVPLLAAGRVLGILSLGAQTAGVFTPEHLRLAKSLAVPAAVAIQNARVHERAEIYAAELEVRLQELNETRAALQRVQKSDV